MINDPQISAAFGREKLISTAALIHLNTVLSGINVIKPRPKISAVFLEQKVNKRRGVDSRKLGTFPYTLWNLTFIRTCFYEQITCKIVFHTLFLLKKLTAKTVDEDPTACQRWISRKEI